MIRSLLFTIVLTGLFAGTSAAETVDITAAKAASADHGRVTVTLVKVLEDSRCPANVNCIWAGNAKISVLVRKGHSKKLVELNTTTKPRAATVLGYKLTLVGLTSKEEAAAGGKMHARLNVEPLS